MILPPAIFSNVFDAYNFSIISSLFDSIMPYAISTHNRKVRTKRIIFGKALRIRVKNFKQNLPENYSQNAKIAITVCKFLKFFRESMPPDPLQSFSCFSISFVFVLPKKNTLEKNVKIMLPPSSLLKFLATPLLLG